MQQILKSSYFDLAIDSEKQTLNYCWYYVEHPRCILTPNSSDKQHGNNLGITALEHKIIHELSHYYVGVAYEKGFCEIVRAHIHGLEMPPNAAYFEEIIFSMVYFSLEKKMLYNNWWSYLDRLHDKVDVFELKDTILHKFNLVKAGKRIITL